MKQIKEKLATHSDKKIAQKEKENNKRHLKKKITYIEKRDKEIK